MSNSSTYQARTRLLNIWLSSRLSTGFAGAVVSFCGRRGPFFALNFRSASNLCKRYLHSGVQHNISCTNRNKWEQQVDLQSSLQHDIARQVQIDQRGVKLEHSACMSTSSISKKIISKNEGLQNFDRCLPVKQPALVQIEHV